MNNLLSTTNATAVFLKKFEDVPPRQSSGRNEKGYLVTILQWSFVWDDKPRSETAKQIALLIRYEGKDLEKAGIQVIQIDEPAFR